MCRMVSPVPQTLNSLAGLPPLLSVAQVAEVLQCHRTTIYSHIEAGTFPLENVGAGCIKFRKADLEDYLRVQAA